MELGAGLFLAACAAAGFGVTFLSGVPFTLEERIVFGTVLGAAAFALFSFLASMAARDVTGPTDTVGLIAVLAVGAAGVITAREQLLLDFTDARRRWPGSLSSSHTWPLLAVIVICGAWTVHFFHQAYVYLPGGLYVGYVNIWGDWAAHLSFAGSFAYGHNFPPEYPIDPGHHLGYPFMIDFLAADLVPLGLRLTEALTATSTMLALAFPAVLYLTALRFTEARLAAALAVFVFLLSGGLGFVFLLIDVHRDGWAALAHLEREYTLNRDVNLQWLNPVLAYLIPQRSVLFGFSLSLIVLIAIWIAFRERLGWRPFLFCGLVAGVMPVFHVHAYGTVVALTAFWALINGRREWTSLALFFAPALLIGVPILLWMWPPENTSVCGDLPSINGYCIQIGWLSSIWWQHDGILWFGRDFIWFWLWNTSIFLPLLIVAQALQAWFPFPKWFVPMWLWFIVPNIVVLQPWVWDNTKFFVFWALLGSIMVGGLFAVFVRLSRVLVIPVLASMVLLGLAGALDLTRASDFSVNSVQFTDPGGLKVADWVRRYTSPYAMFVVADEHNSPIPTLAGRRELIGYPGWLWTYGLADYLQKGADDKKILDGDPSTPSLLRKYHIDYVMIGPQELPRGASRAYWDEHGTVVYNDGQYTVYRVRS